MNTAFGAFSFPFKFSVLYQIFFFTTWWTHLKSVLFKYVAVGYNTANYLVYIYTVVERAILSLFTKFSFYLYFYKGTFLHDHNKVFCFFSFLHTYLWVTERFQFSPWQNKISFLNLDKVQTRFYQVIYLRFFVLLPRP